MLPRQGRGTKYSSIGSFASIDCDYSPLPNYRHNYAAKQNISLTFALDDFSCSVCTGTARGHFVLHREGYKVEARDLTPVVFVVSDQNFPPTLPAQCDTVGGGNECIQILRVEDTALQEIAGVFLEASRGFIVPAGSVVVLSSASNLAWVGPAAYASEFVSAKWRLRAAFKNGIEVVHGLPLLLGGVGDSKGIFLFLDFFEWINLDTDKRDIIDTR
jgi:hypothetical protein